MDGVEGKVYDDILPGSPFFSPDSKRVAYGAKRGSKWVAVVDGVEGRECDEIYDDSLVFSPDSQHLAYSAKRRGKVHMKAVVVVDGVEGSEYDDFLIGVVRKRVVFDSPRQFHVLARRGDEILRVEVELVTSAAKP